MAEPHVIFALRDRYRRVKGQLAALDAQVETLRADLDHIGHVIRLFQDDWRAEDTSAVMPYKPSRWQKRGEGIKTALSVLREATEPLTAREIVLAVWERTGQPLPTKKELYQITSTFNMALGRRIGDGVEFVGESPKRWFLKKE